MFLTSFYLLFLASIPLHVFNMFLLTTNSHQTGSRACAAESDHGTRDVGLPPLLPARHQRRLARTAGSQGRRRRPAL